MKFNIPQHGLDAIKARIGCHPRKHQKLLAKAWRSTEPIEKGDIPNEAWHKDRHDGKTTHRKVMGRIFVFLVEGDTATLLTVHPPATQATNNKNIKRQSEKEKIFMGKTS